MPSNLKPLTDQDVDYDLFHCCGDEDLVFLRCEHCGHIWVECYECSTWYVDLNDLSRQESSFLSDTDARLSCPSCHRAFAHWDHLAHDRYFPNAQQVVEAGLERFLAPHLRKAKEPDGRRD
ncbi:MAG: hypothetical protein H6721_04105 [Sandaracinus sp.]|nr:hypothetical protein [Sandaracinus sp.]MCB9631307.1 hypothetical protein [Sandaracinus sp.]